MGFRCFQDDSKAFSGLQWGSEGSRDISGVLEGFHVVSGSFRGGPDILVFTFTIEIYNARLVRLGIHFLSEGRTQIL